MSATISADPSASGVRISVEGPSVAAIIAALGSVATSAPATSTPGSTTTQPAQTSTPAPAQFVTLTMGAVTDGSPVTLGTGPDTLTLTLANNPSNKGSCSIAVLLDMADGSTHVIAAPLTISSNAGQGGGQLFTLHGTWGALGSVVKNVRIAPANPPGMAGLWQNAVSYNYAPLAAVAGQGYDSRGGLTDGYTPNLFNSNGIAITYQAQPAAKPAQPTSTGTVAPNNLAPAVANAVAGGTLALPSGTTTGYAGIGVACTVAGAADGSTVLDATSAGLFQNKAVLVPEVSGVTIENLTITGASLNAALGGNGAGIRQAGAGIDFTVRNVKVHGCQDGLLTFNGNITVDACDISDNGTATGYEHNAYFGAGAGTVTVTNTTSKRPHGGHALKCRTTTLRVSGGEFEGGGNASVIDLPEGGDHVIDGATLRLLAGAANTVFVTYGVENANAASAGKTLILRNLVLDNQTGGATHLIGPGTIIPDAVLVLQNVTAKGPIPDISGFAQVQGTITAA